MNPSPSLGTVGIVLPVWNAANSLRRQVHDLLEVLPDLAGCFEVVIVDDGSSDETPEIGHELSVTYPQVRFARHQQQRGEEAAIQTGLARLTTHLVLVQRRGQPLALAATRLPATAEALANTDRSARASLLRRLAAWARSSAFRLPAAELATSDTIRRADAAQPTLRRRPSGAPVLRRRKTRT